MNWDDLRFLAVIGREGTMTGAARRLKVDQTTVARRLRALEESLGVPPLFERGDGRWLPTAVGARLLERVARIEEEVAGLSRLADDGAVEGVVRVTAVGTIAADWLVPRLPALYARYPGLTLELVASNDNLSVARREADIAIRLARPSSGAFLIRKLADLGLAVYRAAQAETAPGDWVCYGEALADTPEMRWLAPQLAAGRVRLASDSVSALLRACAAGIGQAVLPCFVADATPGLLRVSGPAPVVSRELWLLVHPEARRQARVAAVADWLAAACAADGAALRGDAG